MIPAASRDAPRLPGAILALAGVLACSPAQTGEVEGRGAEGIEPAATPVVEPPDPAAPRGISDVVVPGGPFGPVHPDASEADIIDAVGQERYARRPAELGEGMCAPGGVLFPDSPDEISVAFVDSMRTLVARAVARREGRWRTAEGVAVGMTLAELQELNGAPVTFTGFNWDRGGTVIGYGDGALAHYREGTGFFLGLDARPHVGERELVGDRDVSSGHPSLSRYEVRVRAIEAFWRVSRGSFDCELQPDGSLRRVEGG